MYLAKVVGTVVSTNRNPQLYGMKLLLIQRLTSRMEAVGNSEIAVDSVGAGIDETVIVTRGGAARVSFAEKQVPVDATIVEIVDVVEVKHG